MNPVGYPPHDPEEAGGLFEGFFSEAGDLHKVTAASETALLIAQRDYISGDTLAQPRYPCQKRHRSGIDVHANRVNAVLHHAVQLPGQLQLADIVLVLAYTNGLWIDLDQLRQRVL